MSVGRIKISLLVVFICVMIAACFGCSEAPEINGEEELIPEEPAIKEDEVASPDENDDADLETITEKLVKEEEKAETPVEPATSTLYYIDYENGSISIGDLPIGARVVDPSWEWEYKRGYNYSERDWYNGSWPPGEVKPVTWIVVAKDHYNLGETHVTLLSEELIGKFTFDNSTGRDHEYSELGFNHWGDSGTGNASNGLRPWLNSTGIHAGEGFFYQAFSLKFMMAVLTTPMPNREWKEGKAYITNDNVFIPSTTELGDTEYPYTYQIGTAYPYFQGEGAAKRVAELAGESWFYWTRSPDSRDGYSMCMFRFGNIDYNFANNDALGVRPALNLKSDTLVSEIRN